MTRTSSSEKLSPNSISNAFVAPGTKLADVRKEQGARIGIGTVLAEEPEMVASQKGLQARANIHVTVILSQLISLVHPVMPVAQIRRLRVAEVSTEALL